VKVKGISWAQGDDHKNPLDRTWGDAPYERYDFASPVHKNAALPRGRDNEGHEVQQDPQNGWQHLDGSVSHDDGTTVSDHPVTPYTHDHEWLPQGKYWGPNSAQNDQRLFVGSQLRPEVREDILTRVGGFFASHGYQGWRNWARVYFAGSEAAKWAPFNGDFDVLIGVNWPVFHQENPTYADKGDLQMATAMTDGLWQTANVNGYYFTLADGKKVGPFDRTFFVNPVAWDIRKIHPYAAYDVTNNRWAVQPMKVPDNWSAESLPESYWTYAEALGQAVKAIGALPAEERGRMARNLWEEIHTHRSDAFTDGGHGLFDLSNVVEKYLDQHPDKLWDKLRAWKRGLTQEAALKSVTDLEGADYTGVMIALVPPKEICKTLAVEGGEDVSTMHITLAYLGGQDNHEAEDLASLPDLVKAWAAHQKPLTASVGGVGTFVNPTQHVLWAHADIPHGTTFRDSLVSMLEEHGYDVRHDHGWVPHITLKYGKQPFRFMPKVAPASWDVNEIWCCVGGSWESFPIGG
jgi:2'-5' RNA ligase